MGLAAFMVLCTLFVLNGALMVDGSTAKSAAIAQFSYQNVKVELFTDDEDVLPCSSPDNYTLNFKNMKLDTADCVTHLFPQPTSEEGEKWMQFSAKATVRPDSGLQIWLFFTRDDISGAITHCAEENIQNLPYPLEVAPSQNGACQIISIPNFQFDDEDETETEQRTMSMRVTYDVVKAARLAGAMRDSAGCTPRSSIGSILLGITTFLFVFST